MGRMRCVEEIDKLFWLAYDNMWDASPRASNCAYRVFIAGTSPNTEASKELMGGPKFAAEKHREAL